MSGILSDKRRIVRVCQNDGENGYWIGVNSTVEIIAYADPGPYCDQPWLLVHERDGTTIRLNAAKVASIHYAPEGAG